MADSEFPAPQSGFVLTHFLVVSDQDRSREFYRSVFGATVVLERDPVILKLATAGSSSTWAAVRQTISPR
jgi:lactoylglutathione lyase